MWLCSLRDRGLAVRAAVLVAALVAVYLLVVPPAWHFVGPETLAAATVAAVSCLACFVLALVAGEPLRARGRVLHGMLVGMAFRMGVPLAVAVVVHLCADDLVHAGFLYWLVVFFETGLLVEVFLSLPKSEPRPSGSGVREVHVIEVALADRASEPPTSQTF